MPISEKPEGKLPARKTAGKEQKKKEIPKEFMKQIKKLGMKEEDAEVLYQTKIDWAAVYSENKIHCAEKGCDYYTKMDTDDLRNHMITQHNYGEYPCTHSDCNFVAYSEVLNFGEKSILHPCH